MRAPFQEGDFPGPVKYGYLNVGVGRARTAGAARPNRLLPLSAPDRLRRAGERRGARAGRRAAGACRACRDRRDRRQCPVGRRAAARRPASRLSAPAWSAAAWHACWLGSRARRSRSSMSTPTAPMLRPRSASTSPCLPRPPAVATWLCTPAPPPPGCSVRLTCSPRRAPSSTSAGTATRRFSSRSGVAFHSARLGIRASQVGTVSPARSARRTTADRLALVAGPPARPRVRRAPHRRVSVRRTARGAWPGWPRGACRRSATPSPTTGGRPCSA